MTSKLGNHNKRGHRSKPASPRTRTSGRVGHLFALLFLTGACSDVALGPPAQPFGWDQQVAPPEAIDLDPAPHVVEIALEARVTSLELVPGTTTPCYTYGERIPGPVIRAQVGDRLKVHFTNHLPEPTTIHWHGLRIPNAMDGVPGQTQEPVMPGATFDYDFVVPDAGTFWYHPHVDSAVQVGKGLYGAVVVTDPAEVNDLGDELVLVLSDIGVDEKGVPEPANSGGDLGTLFGREGSLVLANGRVNPTLQARGGLRQHWRIVNAAKTRYFQLAWEGHTFLRIGSDGGRLAAPQQLDRVLLTPGQRAEVLVVPTGVPGTSSPVRWVAYDRGFGSTFNRPDVAIMTVALSSAPAVVAPHLPALRREIVPWSQQDRDAATPVALSLTQGKTSSGSLLLSINDRSMTDWANDPLPAQVGERQLWTVKNTVAAFAHPFHLHGFFFQVLDATGAPLEPLEWRDTADVPVDGTLAIGIHYDDRPGMWMFHCHILDHADAGMMGMVMLERAQRHH